MRGRPPGSIVTLSVSWGEVPPVDTFLLTAAGSAYHVLDARGRRITCLKLVGAEAIPDDADVWGWAFAPRSRKLRSSM